MTNARTARFPLAIILALFIATTAVAQSRAAQTTTKEPERAQSTNQIVRVNQDNLPGVEVFAIPQSTAPQNKVTAYPPIAPPVAPIAPRATRNEGDLENAVIPPAPVIIKRSANAISIPVDGKGVVAKSDSKSDSKYDDSKYDERDKYEERPAVASSASVGSVFGYRKDPFTRREKFHSGVDIKARWGDPVGASQAGIVQFAGWYHGYGNMIIVAHGGGVTTHYAHLSSFYVEVGTRVDRGTIIGRAGSTGRATSPHLHYELRFDGNPLNPFQPLALDPSSDYFRQSRPPVDAGRGESTTLAAPLRNK